MRAIFITLFSYCFAIGLTGQADYNLTFVGQKTYTQDLNDVWGWKSSSGTEYALVGTTTGTSFVSLATVATPTEVQFISGAQSIWRDLKTFGNYCYVTCDQGKDGLLIIDLSTLPGSVNYINWRPVLTINGNTDTFNTAHNLYIDENGFCYIAGSNINNGEPFILDLNSNPWNPTLVGFTPNVYAHDVYARGDTLWTSDIYAGEFSGYDVSNKAALVLLGSHLTPRTFTHNAWISDNGNTLFTTDEQADAWIGSYDVSDMGNITELDRWRPLETEGTGVIPHNVHVKNDFVIISHYTDGVIVLDGSRPANLVEVGRYDSYTTPGQGFNGCWGVYPFFVSGLIIASDINTGLHVLQPAYQRACWLEGNVTDTLSNAPLANVRVVINTTAVYEDSRINGDYKTGYGIAGSYTVTYSKTGYYSKTLTINLQNGLVNLQNVQLMPMVSFAFSGQVIDADNANAPIANAKVLIESENYTYNAITDAGGNFNIPAMFQDNYSIYAGKWGYKTVLQNSSIDATTTAPILALNRGYRDEFALDLGWTITGNASSGVWERVVSEEILFGGQPATPNSDLGGDIGNKCFVTGANNAGTLSADDVDGGNTILRSPNFNLSTYNDAYLSYYPWFIVVQGTGTPNDSMIVRIYNGSTSAVLATYSNTIFGWRPIQNFKITDYITTSATMWIEVETFDRSPGHVVEAAFDLFEVVDSGLVSAIVTAPIQESQTLFEAFPNPFDNNLSVDIRSEVLLGQNIRLFDKLGRLLLTQKVTTTGKLQLQLPNNLPAGLYSLHLGEKAIKILKTK